MKIKNKQIYTATIYKACNIDKKENFVGDCCLADMKYDKKPYLKKAVMIKFGFMYVPIYHVDNFFKYMGIKAHVKRNGAILNPDHRFFDVAPSLTGAQKFFVEDVEAFTEKRGKTDTKLLLKAQQENLKHSTEDKVFDI